MKLGSFALKVSTYRMVAFSFFLICCFPNALMAKEIFVSKTGDDIRNNGLSVKTAFCTIQRASDMATAGDTVTVLAGIYREQVDIKTNDIFYRTYQNDKVVLNGTDMLLLWQYVSGNTYKTIMNWELAEKWGSNQLFSDGKMIELARWPDQKSEDIIMPTNAKADSVSSNGHLLTIYDHQFNEPNARWVGARIWINLSRMGYDGQGWTGTVISHTKNIIVIDFKQNPILGNQPWGLGPEMEYFLFNPTQTGVQVSGGVDALLGAGEWWKDDDTVYVKLANGGAPSSSGAGKNLVEAKRRYFGFWSTGINSGYTINGFELFGCAITTDPNAITNRAVADAHDVLIEDLKVRYSSHITFMDGIWFDPHYTWSGIAINGHNNTIKNCDIKYTAASAISIQGVNNKVIGNILESTNYMCSNSGSLNTGFTSEDPEIAYNKISNTTLMGINFKYAKNSDPNIRDRFRIHHNEIFNFMRRSGDSGAIDMVGADLQWVRIDHNLIYNTLDDAKFGALKHGIYLDFGSVGDNLRATIDHNIIYEVTTPLLINDGRNVNAFNNVLLSHGIGENAQYAIGNFNGKSGDDVKIYNNIMSGPPNITGCCGDFSESDLRNNIMDAVGSVLDSLFVDAPNRDYRLRSTAYRAIDKGISVGKYDEGVQGIADIGAYEWGTLMLSPDNTPPSKPTNLTTLETSATSVDLSWNPSTDNIAVASYDIFVNGIFRMNTPLNQAKIRDLNPITQYAVKIVALDATGNRSGESIILKLTTKMTDGDVMYTATLPIIDGAKDAVWSGGNTYQIAKTTAGVSPNKFEGNWTSLWDDDNLYLYIEVAGANKTNPASVWYSDNHIEIYIDAEADGGLEYFGKDYQYYIRPGDSSLGEAKKGAITNTEAVTRNTELGYVLETKIPWSTLKISPRDLNRMGLDIMLTDVGDLSEEKKLMWHSQSEKSYKNPSLIGTVQLKKSNDEDHISPSKPKKLMAWGRSQTGFELAWDSSEDNKWVSGYEVFVNGVLFATEKQNTVVLSSLNPNTLYKVKVRARDASGNLSKFSKQISINTRGNQEPKIYEAELGVVTKPAEVAHNNQTGYSGKGYVTGFSQVGASVTFSVEVEKTATYDALIRYANSMRDALRTEILVNGQKQTTSFLPFTNGGGSWKLKSERLKLEKGRNEITVVFAHPENGGANIDCLMLYSDK